MYDFIIIGAGPSGATFARLIDKKYKTLIIDKRDMNNVNDFRNAKCCGGLLAPDAQKELSKQGLNIPKHILIKPQPFKVKCIDFDNKNNTKIYPRNYINTQRELFDKWLFSLIDDNIEKKLNTIFRSYKKIDNVYEVSISQNNKKEVLKTKYIIDASGATSGITRKNYNKNELPQVYKAIQKSYIIKDNMSYFLSFFDNEITDYYGWAIPKGDELLIGIATQYNNSNTRFDIALDKLKKIGYKLGECTKTEGALIFRPKPFNNIHPYKDNILFIGESAGFISPSSAEGISYALKTAKKLAKAINNDYDNFKEIYAKKIKKEKNILRLKNIKSKIVYSKFIRNLIFKTGLLAIDINKDE